MVCIFAHVTFNLLMILFKQHKVAVIMGATNSLVDEPSYVTQVGERSFEGAESYIHEFDNNHILGS